jgi:CTP:molybdopterin cytidylyltransferase MocA
MNRRGKANWRLNKERYVKNTATVWRSSAGLLEFWRRVIYAGGHSVKRRERIVPIILAAGPSDALPFPKALARFGGKTALAIAVENCREIGRAIVVIGCDAELLRRAIPKGVRVVLNAKWREGQLRSLLCALKVVPKNAAILIYPVDHPLLRKATIRKLVAEFYAREPDQDIVMPRYGRSFGHPVIVAAGVRDEFFQAKTAREVVYRRPERIRIVRRVSREIFEDFNTKESYQRCVQRYESRLRKAKQRVQAQAHSERLRAKPRVMPESEARTKPEPKIAIARGKAP